MAAVATEYWGRPACGHAQYTKRCIFCTQWAYLDPDVREKASAHREAKASTQPVLTNPEKIRGVVNRVFGLKHKPAADPIVRRNVAVPPVAERISLPVRPPCKYEGAATVWCRACNQDFKVRHCEHPDA